MAILAEDPINYPITRKQLTLPLPLGKWQQASPIAPGWYYAQNETAIYQQSTIGWMRHGTCPRQSCTWAFHREGSMPSMAPDESLLQVASVAAQGGKLILTGIGQSKAAPPITPTT